MLYFELYINQRIMKKHKWAANQDIIMIYDRSCDTEDWSNDADNTALHHRNKLHFKIYSVIYFNLKLF